MSDDVLELSADGARVRVDLEGGRLASLMVRELELLVTEGAKPSRFGSFPMVPWCGRLAHGRFAFEGEEHRFPLTSPPHANHGRGYLQRWERVEAGRSASSGTLRTELGAPWPFGGQVLQHFELHAERLRVTLEVHAHERQMPAMVGWHPWFRRELERGGPAELVFRAREAYAVDGEQLPTGKRVPPPPTPWDDCFVGLEEGPTLTWPGALRLELSSNLDHWVVFTKPEHALCVEPQSGPPNEPNTAPRIVEPGKPLVGWMELAWTVFDELP